MELISFPNITGSLAAAFQQWAAEQRQLQLPVGDRTPRPRPAEFIRLWVSGGDRPSLVTDRPTVIVEAYADRNSRAAELADLFRAWLHSFAGEEIEPGCPLNHVSEYARPASLPHPDTEQARYTATYSLDIRGTTL